MTHNHQVMMSWAILVIGIWINDDSACFDGGKKSKEICNNFRKKIQ